MKELEFLESCKNHGSRQKRFSRLAKKIKRNYLFFILY